MDTENTPLNPIDVVEDVIYHKKWNFSRAADHELVAEIASEWCQYRLYFNWSERINAMSFTVTFDIRFPKSKYISAYELLGLINENYNADIVLWNLDDLCEIPYWHDSSSSKISKVFKNGLLVFNQ